MAEAPVQSILDVQDVRDDTIILKDGSLRSVLAASSINFELKSSEEQEAIILQYQSFLNTLDFPLQILLQSRDLDIEPYLDVLRKRQQQQSNELLRIQTSEYVRFIEEFVEFANIMQKRFYIVVPFAPVEKRQEDGASGILQTIQSLWKPVETATLDDETFRSYRDQLFQRVAHVETAIAGTGINTQRLNSDQLITLLHQSYNPGVGRARRQSSSQLSKSPS